MVQASPTGFECESADNAGGSGFSSASVGPSSCATVTPLGATSSATSSASGSWITGDFAVAAEATANPGTNSIGEIGSTGTATFTAQGLVTLPSGMASASITFGATGVSGILTAGPAVPQGGASSGDMVTLSMAAGGSGGTSGTSIACLTDNLFLFQCPNGGFGFGFGPGTLAPITLTVHSGDSVLLNVSFQALADADAAITPEAATASGLIDPLYLTLPGGATFDSGVDGFLSGSPTPAVPEPTSLALFATGLGALAVVHRRRRERHDRRST
jgi:hypothetical protein